MRTRCVAGTLLSIALIGLTGCPGPVQVEPGQWHFRFIAFDPADNFEGGIELFADGTVGPYQPDPNATLPNINSWWQFGDTFTMEWQVATDRRILIQGTFNGSDPKDLHGNLYDGETLRDYLIRFRAEWVADPS